MYNLGDDSELDRLSREAAGRYETPGNANWQALSEELDKVMPQEKRKRFLFWWILPGLLAGGAITYGIIQRDNNTASVEKNIPAAETDKTNDQSTNVTATATDKLTGKKETPAQDQSSISVTNPQSTATTKVDVSERNATGTNIPSTKKIRSYTSKANANSPVIAMDKTETVLTPVTQAVSTPEQPSKPIEQVPAKEQKEPTKEITQADQPQTAIAKTEVQPNVEQPAQPEKKPVRVNQLPPRGKGWSFSPLIGIDKSTVKLKYGYKPGINLGLIVGYHFNDTWAVKTGAIYTQKNYKLAGEDFTAPKGSWVSYYKIDAVEGYCRMWEVPLLASYTIHSQGKKSVTLNGGLSSYFMTKEDYDYYYYYNGSPTSRNASYNSMDKHILSIAHLSAAFENRISKSMSLQVEPYAKIPMGGVGFGNIKLSSFGVNFSVQYRQPAKK